MIFLFKYFKKIIKQNVASVMCFFLLIAFSGTAFAIKDQSCFECHQDPTLKQIMSTGDIRSIYVDPKKWDKDIHHENGIKCIDCHEGMTPFSHPKEGSSHIACDGCHPEACEENLISVHNRFMGITDKSLPECYDCHTKHSVKGKSDPRSPINGENIGEVCLSCHEEIRQRGMTNFFPLRIFLGHRKCDINDKNNIKICINCHGDAGHGPLETYPEYCIECHNTNVKGGFLSATHPWTSDKGRPYALFTENIGLSLNLIFIMGAFIGIIIFISRSYRIKKQKPHKKPNHDNTEFNP